MDSKGFVFVVEYTETDFTIDITTIRAGAFVIKLSPAGKVA